VESKAKQAAAWSALKNPIFRSLWIANVVSGIGGTMHDTAAVWTMTTLTTSATLVGLMQTVTALPLFLFALPAGALADIVDRRRQILTAQIGCLVVAGDFGSRHPGGETFCILTSWNDISPGYWRGLHNAAAAGIDAGDRSLPPFLWTLLVVFPFFSI
jgi:MFS family permease